MRVTHKVMDFYDPAGFTNVLHFGFNSIGMQRSLGDHSVLGAG